jgi:pimeloyl-ACP methyl ester carboxylesterase
MIPIFYLREAGAKGLLPLSPAPQIPAEPASASLRRHIFLDHSEHLLHNHHASVASLRLLFTFTPEWCSPSLRNHVRLHRNTQLPDSRAQGKSGGDFPTYGIKESDDVHRWFDWLVTQQRPKCIFGMGESMGAAIILQSVKTTPFCAVVAESSFASFRQIGFVRVGQVFRTGPWLGRIVLRPAVEAAFLYGRLTRGVYLADASPQVSVAGSRVPIFLIHGLADDNIPFQQSETIRARNPADITLWEVPLAGHCGAVNADQQEFDKRVLGWFTSLDRQ